MKLVSKSTAQTLKIGRKVARVLRPGDIICLFGELGAGKTVLTKGIAEGLGINRDKVISPSFVLLRQYLDGKLPLYHFDLYRLRSELDILDLGYQEYLYSQGVSVIEWAGRMRRLLPGEFLKIELSISPGMQRTLNVSAFGKRYQQLMKELYENIGH